MFLKGCNNYKFYNYYNMVTNSHIANPVQWRRRTLLLAVATWS